jgi:hypothetical protein
MNRLLKINEFFMQNLLCNLLHNGEDIWYSKYEFILQDFEAIKKINCDVTVICGNSDYSFNQYLLDQKPDNVKRIFATNSTCSDNKLVFSLPIGIESSFPTKREGHGFGFCFSDEKHYHINRVNLESFDIKNLIYSNFSINTNPNVRGEINDKIKKSKYVTIESDISFKQYYDQISSHEAVLCPIGNGLDTVRTYEAFYCGKIPIIYGSDLIYKDIFYDMPCVYISDIDEINDEKYIFSKIEDARTKKNKINKAYLNYWIEKILKNG